MNYKGAIQGRIRWGDSTRKEQEYFSRATNLSMEQLENIDKVFQEYPTLIYDGPFSDHMTNRTKRFDWRCN